MDLVDIDQVLDNLELRIAADEQQSRNAAAAATAAATPPIAKICGEGRPMGDGSSGIVNGKSFVGVSQVFNSLDDYRNDVKSLETATNQKYNWQVDEVEVEEAEVEMPKSRRDIVNNTEDDALLNHEDINKFSEVAGNRPLASSGGDAIISSSESLTTSSCSTFSSGPSPAHVSNSEEMSTPPESEKPSALEVLPVSQPQPPPPTEPPQPPQATATTTTMSTSPGPAVEDLAAGLSSISITNTNTTESQSILPCNEVTVSSALCKVLNELSAETNETQTSRNVKSMEEGEEEEQQAVNMKTTEYQPQGGGRGAAAVTTAPTPTPSLNQHPIKFCSTMDEISDTELDSMLQEIDIDDSGHLDGAAGAATMTTTSTMMTMSGRAPGVPHEMIDDSDCASISPPTEEESVRILSDQETTSADQMNVDNFSQASTVEFADLRAHEATPVTAMGNDLASSFSSTESDSLSGRKFDFDDDEEVQEAAAEDEGRPERPKTLQLSSSTAPAPGQDPSEDPAANGGGGGGVAAAPGESAFEEESPIYEAVGYSDPHANLGKVPPIWVPDNMAAGCMQCQQKFSMIKRRHHCRACGKVLCSVCCSQRFHLEFASEPESRVCVQCFMILSERQAGGGAHATQASGASASGGGAGAMLPPTPIRSPNPNNPMEYCSTIPPHRQVVASAGAPPPSVIVPVGVLKKPDSSGSGSSSSSANGAKTRKRKSVMFSDGIAPGSELASAMEEQWNEAKHARRGRHSSNKPPTPGHSIDSMTMGLVAQLFRGAIPPSAAAAALNAEESSSPRRKLEAPRTATATSATATTAGAAATATRKLPNTADAQGCFIPLDENALPPICVGDHEYKEVTNDVQLMERLHRETLKFIVKNNFYVLVKIVNLNCCMNRWVINFTTSGMHYVGNDEIIILLEINAPKKAADDNTTATTTTTNDNESSMLLPRDIFQHLYEIYTEAEHARSIVELAFSSPRNANFLGSREHGGFIYIRPSYQCLQNLIVPDSPYLVGVLLNRHEVPWAKVLPLRLVLRLGAQYRYYPCPLISVRQRESVYGDIAQTIINFLADFRNYSYTLPAIRGLYIHMEERQTTLLIPRYRHNDVIKAINNASDHILAFAGNFSKVADGHLVCMQNVNDDNDGGNGTGGGGGEMYSYSTQAINIQGQPRKVTGASFFVLNEALKSTSGLSGKCSIVEDGLMVQILPTKMEEVRNALRNRTDIDIICGPLEASEENSEIVSIKWVDNDRDINVGVKSPIDERPMDGVANMRVHASFNYSNTNYLIRLTDIFILTCDEWYATNGENFSDITRIAEQLARSTSMALLPYLDLLAAAGISKIGLRATLDQENVGYEAGARGSKLPPLYMNALDNHLIATLHGESSNIEQSLELELVFYILNV